MKRLNYFFIAALLYNNIWVDAQSFIPYNISEAVEKGTRTNTGIPGEGYFQNSSKYIIDAKFDPKSGKLNGKAKITYFNNSPDTLKRIVIRLYQNMGKKGGIRDESFPSDDIHNGVSITSFLIDNYDMLEQSKFKIRQEGTNVFVVLGQALFPSDSCKIQISWDFTMPKEHVHRFGKYGEGNYFVAYWYPQLAVYDDIDGWDRMNYTGTHEFYNDFNSYDITIKVPDNHFVWATGNWQNPDKVIHEKLFGRLKIANQSDEIVQIITSEDWRKKEVFNRNGSHTFHFTMDSISDFAFAVSNNYLWDATSVIVDSMTQKRAWISSVYNAEARNFKNVASIASQVIREFSFNSYGISFPFPGITVFNGEGGMEFPMMANDENLFLSDGTIFITMHEVAHSYFPFYVGTNERKYSWMDEGLTTYLPVETEIAMNSDYYPIELILSRYNADSGTETDVPLYVPAYQTREYSYQFYSYIRPATAFYMLEEYIGRDSFRNAIKEFMEIWHYKHPTSYDLFALLKKNTDKDIDWFIDAWFFEAGWPDLAIGEVVMESGGLNIEIIKKGSFPVPIVLTIEYQDGNTEVVQRGLEIWRENSEYSMKLSVKSDIKSIQLDYLKIPDKDHSNNSYRFNAD